MMNQLGQILAASGQLPGAPQLPQQPVMRQPNFQLAAVPPQTPAAPPASFGQAMGNIGNALMNLSPEAQQAMQVFGFSLLNNDSLGGAGLKAIQSLKALKDQQETKRIEQSRYDEQQRNRVRDKNEAGIERAQDKIYRQKQDTKAEERDKRNFEAEQRYRDAQLQLDRHRAAQADKGKSALDYEMEYMAQIAPEMPEAERYVTLQAMKQEAARAGKDPTEARSKAAAAYLNNRIKSRPLGMEDMSPQELAKYTQEGQQIAEYFFPSPGSGENLKTLLRQQVIGSPPPGSVNPDRGSNQLFQPGERAPNTLTIPSTPPAEGGPRITPPAPSIGGNVVLKSPDGRTVSVVVTPIDTLTSLIKLPNGKTLTLPNADLQSLMA